MQKKRELAKIIAHDKEANREYKNLGNKLDRRTSDFDNHNVLSYVYEHKEHKSI